MSCMNHAVYMQECVNCHYHSMQTQASQMQNLYAAQTPLGLLGVAGLSNIIGNGSGILTVGSAYSPSESYNENLLLLLEK